MKAPEILTRTRKELDLSSYRFTYAKESDFEELVGRSAIIIDQESERVCMIYLELEEPCDELVEGLQQIEYRQQERSSGMKTTSRIFGYRPRITYRDDFCTDASLARENARVHSLVTSYAKKVATYYQQYNPELYEKHHQLVEKVLPEWKLESVFTSGIINKNNPLAYHFDAGNFKGVWSNMLAFRKDVVGGYLSVPEYNLGFAIKHNSLLMFDGQHILHGVTPLTKLSPDAFRFTIVYYSLQSMWQCLPPKEEISRIRKLRTEREERRLERTERGETLEEEFQRKGKAFS